MLSRYTLFTFFLIFCLQILPAFAHTDGGIVVKDAWIREAPPVVKVLAAYMTIENHTNAATELVSITSSAFKNIEIHRTDLKGGMASMEKQNNVPIEAENSLKLEPNGMHLMLFEPTNPLRAGDIVSFVLRFANGKKSIVSAKVRKAANHQQAEHKHEGLENHSMESNSPEGDHSHNHHQ